MKIQRIDIRSIDGLRRASFRIRGMDYAFRFSDLVEFSDGLGELVAVVDGLSARNVTRPKDRTLMQIESIKAQDAAEYNRNLYSAREVRERRAGGEHIAGGDWYMEISMNGADTDISFNTTVELFQIVQQIIQRELVRHGQVAIEVPPALTHA